MKKIFITIIVLFYFLSNANTQWIQQFSSATNALLSVKFINNFTGYISGRDGVILKTTNSGNNWNLVCSNLTGKSMYGLSVVNENVVYSVGYFETLIKSTNGGINWTYIKNGPFGYGHSYEGVFFINENTGWICGSGQKIFKTTNGGVTFDSVSIPVGYNYDIYFRNEYEGLVCGEAASMYKTSNGGLNWSKINVPVANQASDFYRMSFINLNTGYTQGVGNNKIYKTTNFGGSWDSVARVQGADLSYTVFFSNENTGWCAGTYGLMFKTINGGWNWQQVNLSQFNTAFFRGLWFSNDSVGWAVGGLGKILYTSNGGATFIKNENLQLIKEFNISQNFPNPFNNRSIIIFKVSFADDYIFEVFNILGQKLLNNYFDNLNPGEYKIDFDGKDFSSNIYFYRLSNSRFSITKTMTIIK